jgi:hypothetical protein
MATFTKQVLSGSTDGKMIKVAATATAGTLRFILVRLRQQLLMRFGCMR